MATFKSPSDFGGGGGTPSNTVVTETSYGQASTAGVSTDYSRADHTHGTPAALTAAVSVVAETTYGQASAVGVSTNYARQDHTHGTPPDKSNILIYMPGGVAAGNVYTTIASLETAASVFVSTKIIYWDVSLGTISIPAGSYSGIVENATWIGLQDNTGSAHVLINIEDNALFTSWPDRIINVNIEIDSSTVPLVTLPGLGNIKNVYVENSIIGSYGTLESIEVDSTFELNLSGTSNLANLGKEIFNLSSGGSSSLYVYLHDNSSIEADTVAGPGQLSVNHLDNASTSGDTHVNLSGPFIRGNSDIEQETFEYWIDSNQATNFAKKRYSTIAEVIAETLFLASISALTVGQSVTIHLPKDNTQTIPLDLSGASIDNPIIIKGGSSRDLVSTQCILDFAPMDGILFPCNLLLQGCKVKLSGYSILPTRLSFEDCTASEDIGTVYFSSGSEYVYINSDLSANGNLTSIWELFIGSEDSTTVKFEDSEFYTLLDGTYPQMFFAEGSDGNFIFNSKRTKFRLDNQDIAGNAMFQVQSDTTCEWRSEDDRYEIEGNIATTDPIKLVASTNASSFAPRIFTGLRINALNASQPTTANAYDRYITPGELLQAALDDSDNSAKIIWEGSKTRLITDADSPYVMLPEDRYIEGDTSAGAITVRLIDPSKCPGRVVEICRIGANNLTLNATVAGGTINGNPTYGPLPDYAVITIRSTGTDWRIV